MSQETPIILYIGDSETGKWLDLMLSSWQGYVYTRDELFAALGVYASYQPDLVILDARIMPKLAQQAYLHLQSVVAQHLVIIAGKTEKWAYPAGAHMRVLNSGTIPDLLSAVDAMLRTSTGAHSWESKEIYGCSEAVPALSI